MTKHALWSVAVLLAAGLWLGTLWAQQPGPGQVPGQGQGQGQGPRTAKPGGSNPAAKDFKPPTDPRLIKLHEDFVYSAEKLAADYERNNDIDKARSCYERILRLVPTYAPAREKLDALHNREATAERKVFDVLASKGWQDTGIMVVEGRPLIISATGKWNFKMSYELTPDGIEIPPELRDFNLGSLIGIIQTPNQASGTTTMGEGESKSQPFFIGQKKEFVATHSGKLFLRMYDSDASDNVGKLTVTITGTFGKK